MGLVVRVYKNVQLTDNEEEYAFYAYVVVEKWAYKIRNLKYGKWYSGDCVDSTIEYTCSTHNRFREELIKLIGRNDLLLEDGTIDWYTLQRVSIPFQDFIDFADNEGCLDWEVSEKIYNDFKAWESKASELPEYYSKKYFDWLKVFELAKDKGVVVFR